MTSPKRLNAQHLREGDQLPLFEFTAADGSTWSTDAHLTHTPLVLILHRHLA